MDYLKKYGAVAKGVLFWAAVAAFTLIMVPIIFLWSVKAWVELG
jgi:hypothetical protein